MERNKIFYLYKVVEEVLDLSKEEVFNLSLMNREMIRESLRQFFVAT